MEGTVKHRTLVVLGHPSPEDSRINRHLADSLRGLPDVSVRNLAAVRGASGFDVTAEQEALRAHGTVVLQFPWHWYSVPGILKEWMDQVLTYGFAYGAGGDALRGKRLIVATSTGGPESSYGPAGHNRFTMAELMRPIEATAHLCGMNMLQPLVLHGARAVDDGALAAHTLRYQGILTGATSAAVPA